MKKLYGKISKVPGVYYFLLLTVISLFSLLIRQNILWKQCSRYTIGKFIRFSSVGRTGRSGIFKYNYEGVSKTVKYE